MCLSVCVSMCQIVDGDILYSMYKQKVYFIRTKLRRFHHKFPFNSWVGWCVVLCVCVLFWM